MYLSTPPGVYVYTTQAHNVSACATVANHKDARFATEEVLQVRAPLLSAPPLCSVHNGRPPD